MYVYGHLPHITFGYFVFQKVCLFVPYPTNRNSSSCAKNAEGVNPLYSVYSICNLCSTFLEKSGGFFAQKILCLPQMRKILKNKKVGMDMYTRKKDVIEESTLFKSIFQMYLYII